jgi:hypothetical protein
MIEGEVEVLEIDALPQQRGDRFVARTGFDPRAPARRTAGSASPRAASSLARGERDARPRADARRPLVGLTLGRARVAGHRGSTAEATENQTYCSKLARSSQGTPKVTA